LAAGFLSVSGIAIDGFLAAFRAHTGELEALVERSEQKGSSVIQGRFAAECSSAGPVIKDGLTGGTLHLFHGSSVRQLGRELKHTYRALRSYIAPCWRIARSIERLPYKDFIAAIERDGYSTVHFHGVARLHMGKIDFHRVARVAKVPREFRIEEI
jgi:hypothetical protein